MSFADYQRPMIEPATVYYPGLNLASTDMDLASLSLDLASPHL